MNERTPPAQAASAPRLLSKADPSTPALVVLGARSIAVKAGTVFAGRTFAEQTPLVIDVALVPGADYAVIVKEDGLGYGQLVDVPTASNILGGFHFAPGGAATARNGGDSVPAINSHSVWDLNFRPACPDPRGMALIDGPRGRFWCDIYLLGVNHIGDGTSKHGVLIADGDDPPLQPDGEAFDKLNYETAAAVMRHHGKGLLSFEEFVAAAHGVTEKTAISKDPKVTKLDAPRTSKYGVMQATGNLWVWGYDGDPDVPRASLFGGSWFCGDYAGSRHALVAYYWPGDSDGSGGARGRGEHLQLD